MQVLSDIWGILLRNSSVLTSLAQICLSGALTYVTYRYWKETQNQTQEMQQNRDVISDQTEEMRKNREANFKPILRATIRKWTVDGWVITVANTGKGAAQDVFVEACFEEKYPSENRQWSTPLFTPGETKTFRLPLVSTQAEDIINEIGNKSGVLNIDFHYSDVFGNMAENESKIDVIKQVKEGNLPGVKEEEEQEEFYKERREITKREFRSNVIEILEKHGDLTVDELYRISGIHRFYLDTVLIDLQIANVVSFETPRNSSRPTSDSTTIYLR